jgi:phosphopantetheinyl transferase (holo-ACP synthase)
VGVDIEKTSPTIERIRNKFLSAHESEIAFEGIEKSGHRLRQLTLLWSAKESMFKWYSLGQVNFKEHIRWTAPYFIRSGDMGELCFSFCKESFIPLSVYYKLFNDLVLTFVYT